MGSEMKYFRRRGEAEVQEGTSSTLERSLGEQLVLVGPDDAFRRNLRKRLVTVARHRYTGHGVILAESGDFRKALLEAATAGSLFSAAGLAALLLRSHREKLSLLLR